MFQYLSNFGESWGMLNGYNALVFINNHDNQRGHGGGGDIVTFENPYGKHTDIQSSKIDITP